MDFERVWQSGMPFLTEEIWQALPHAPGAGGFLMLQKWPEHSAALDFLVAVAAL